MQEQIYKSHNSYKTKRSPIVSDRSTHLRGRKYFIVPIVDTIPYWIDTRVITTGFKAEKNLTKGTVPVDVNAVLFWKVLNIQKKADHAAMHRAVTEARKTVGKFILALNHPAPGQQDFEVKKPFIQGDQVEHIWLSDVQFCRQPFPGPAR